MTNEELKELHAIAKDPGHTHEDRVRIFAAWMTGELEDRSVLQELTRNSGIRPDQYLTLARYCPVEALDNPLLPLMLLGDPGFGKVLFAKIVLPQPNLFPESSIRPEQGDRALEELLQTRTDLPTWLVSLFFQWPKDMGSTLSLRYQCGLAALLENGSVPYPIASVSDGDWFLKQVCISAPGPAKTTVQRALEHPAWNRITAIQIRFIHPTEKTSFRGEELSLIRRWPAFLRERWQIEAWDFPPDADFERKASLAEQWWRAHPEFTVPDCLKPGLSSELAMWVTASGIARIVNATLYTQVPDPGRVEEIRQCYALIRETPLVKQLWDWRLEWDGVAQKSPNWDAYVALLPYTSQDQPLEEFLYGSIGRRFADMEKIVDAWIQGTWKCHDDESDPNSRDIDRLLQLFDLVCQTAEDQVVLEKELRESLLWTFFQITRKFRAIPKPFTFTYRLTENRAFHGEITKAREGDSDRSWSFLRTIETPEALIALADQICASCLAGQESVEMRYGK